MSNGHDPNGSFGRVFRLKPTRNAWRLAGVGAVAVILLLPLGGIAYSASQSQSPAGAVKLAAGYVKRSGKTVCGKLRTGWTPGTVVRTGLFISDAQQARNYQMLARRAKGKAKTRYLALASTYARRATASQSTCWHLTDPTGAVKLAKDKLLPAGAFVCARLGGKWAPGTLMRSGWFIADAQQARNYQALARRAQGKLKTQYLAQVKFYNQRARNRQATCDRLGLPPTPTVPPRPPQPPPTSTPTPLRFSVAGAVGLALASPSAGTPGSNLKVINATGQLSDAVVSGSATVSWFLIGPDRGIYLVFGSPIDLNNTASIGPGSSRCLLAEVAPGSGVPICIDSTLAQFDGRGVFSLAGVPGFRNPAIQFDSQGALIYSGWLGDGTRVLRKYLNGTTTNIATNVFLSDFIVEPDESIIISGASAGTGTSWIRRITPAGALQTISDQSAWLMATFPDAQPYFGVLGGVRRMLTGTNVLEAKWWIHNGGDTYNDTSMYCGMPPFPGHSMCYGGALYSTMFQTTDGKEYGVVLGNIGGDKSELFELYPTLHYQTTSVADVRVATAAGANVVLSGVNASAQNITTVLDSVTAQGTTLIGPDNEIEIYHLTYLSNANAVLFDGLRFANNQYVIGRIDLSTHQLSVLSTTNSKLADLQVFPGG